MFKLFAKCVYTAIHAHRVEVLIVLIFMLLYCIECLASLSDIIGAVCKSIRLKEKEHFPILLLFVKNGFHN